MNTMILVMEATLPLLAGFAGAALMFGLFALMFPKDMRKGVAVIFGAGLFMAIATEVYERYDILKDYPEDIAIFTDNNLKNMLEWEYISDCIAMGKSNSWDNYEAHSYYRTHSKRVSDGEKLCEFLKDHEVVSFTYLRGGGIKFKCQNKNTGKIVTKTFVTKRQEFEQNHTVLSVKPTYVLCRNKETGKLAIYMREIPATTNWSNI